MPKKKSGLSATIYNDKFIYTFGGEGGHFEGQKGKTYYNEIDKYDIASGVWQTIEYFSENVIQPRVLALTQ